MIRRPGSYELLGETRDDAAGEALDKAARLLELGYPGGPAIEQAATDGDSGTVDFPRPYIADSHDFSFAGLKTALARYVQANAPETTEDISNLAASFQQAVVDTLIRNLSVAARECQAKQVIMAGGVAANRLLRGNLAQLGDSLGVPVACPAPQLCTDNAAMVAAASYFVAQRAGPSPLDMDVFSSLPLSQ